VLCPAPCINVFLYAYVFQKNNRMTTEEISDALDLTSRLMELHGENDFKAKSLKNAAFRLSKTNPELEGKTKEELEKMEGIGKSLAAKIIELQETGTTKELNELLDKTPTGVIEMMSIKGIGPKKVYQLWKELELESIGELYYACNENRLVDLKGFGTKTQEAIKKNIEYKNASAGKTHYGRIIKAAEKIVEELKKEFGNELVSLTGEIYRKNEIIDKIEILIGSSEKKNIETKFELSVPVLIEYVSPEQFYFRLVESSSNADHFSSLNLITSKEISHKSEEGVYAAANVQFTIPELREGLFEIEHAKNKSIPRLIEYSDLKGTVHNHSTYSDGLNTIEQMANRCKEMGLEYFGIADHSQTAFYANGLKPERILEQQDEIDNLNKKLAPFRILKGVESDILNDGSLDYEDEILQTFDYVVASVHSNLRMTEEKAMKRLITAIENPFTTILGHPSGRLLLSRPGYPLDYKKIIDACYANGVVIELNAHPFRLDIDWRWIPYCMEKGVLISINPDAHHVDGLADMYYGVCAARKGMLTKEFCFNALSLDEMESYLSGRLR
jgi:DNA polymerase (family X)